MYRSRATFLLTPLREGRPDAVLPCGEFELISTHAPAGGATSAAVMGKTISGKFLLTPLREGRRARSIRARPAKNYFYSRPCGRGDDKKPPGWAAFLLFLLTPLREGRQKLATVSMYSFAISTHAPAGGAT